MTQTLALNSNANLMLKAGRKHVLVWVFFVKTANRFDVHPSEWLLSFVTIARVWKNSTEVGVEVITYD